MPLYEYKCDNCGKTFEIIQKFSDEPVTVHAECGGAVRRLLSSPALQFKGSGWYVNDYAKSGNAARSKPGADGDSKSDSRSESKPESKSESKPGGSTSSSSSNSESKPPSGSSSKANSSEKK
jgi:putative FmdB family regulatory protein